MSRTKKYKPRERPNRKKIEIVKEIFSYFEKLPEECFTSRTQIFGNTNVSPQLQKQWYEIIEYIQSMPKLHMTKKRGVLLGKYGSKHIYHKVGSPAYMDYHFLKEQEEFA